MTLHKYILIAGAVIGIALIVGITIGNGQSLLGGPTYTRPGQGGTGTTTLPGRGSLLAGLNSSEYCVLATSSNGTILTSSSTATCGVSWEASGAGITSLNGSTSSTQTFATSGPALSISTAGGTHTFTLATSSGSITGVLSSADWTTFNNKIGSLNALTGATQTFATSGASGINIVSSGSTHTWNQPTSTASQSGYLSSADWSTFNNKQNNITFPIPVASTSLVAGRSLTLSTNTVDADEETYATEISLTWLNATTTRDVVRPGGLRAYTLTYFYCATNGANITLGTDERASTTPNTNGTDVFTGGSVTCDSDGFSTTTFSNATIAVEAPLAFEVDSVANATTTLFANFYGTYDD